MKTRDFEVIKINYKNTTFTSGSALRSLEDLVDLGDGLMFVVVFMLGGYTLVEIFFSNMF